MRTPSFDLQQETSKPPLRNANTVKPKNTRIWDCRTTILICFLSLRRLFISHELHPPKHSAEIQMFHTYSSVYITRRLVLNKLHTHTHTYIYRCVCVCNCKWSNNTQFNILWWIWSEDARSLGKNFQFIRFRPRSLSCRNTDKINLPRVKWNMSNWLL
jgi:hypothetical protein